MLRHFQRLRCAESGGGTKRSTPALRRWKATSDPPRISRSIEGAPGTPIPTQLPARPQPSTARPARPIPRSSPPPSCLSADKMIHRRLPLARAVSPCRLHGDMARPARVWEEEEGALALQAACGAGGNGACVSSPRIPPGREGSGLRVSCLPREPGGGCIYLTPLASPRKCAGAEAWAVQAAWSRLLRTVSQRNS